VLCRRPMRMLMLNYKVRRQTFTKSARAKTSAALI
jgi:hypothetical protein